jgi:hypothetical protein
MLVGSDARVSQADRTIRLAINAVGQSGAKSSARRFDVSPGNHQHEVGGPPGRAAVNKGITSGRRDAKENKAEKFGAEK